MRKWEREKWAERDTKKQKETAGKNDKVIVNKKQRDPQHNRERKHKSYIKRKRQET